MANILIIEDNLMNLEMAGELLRRSGHNVIKAENAAKGIKLAGCKSPDLILMDINLPDIDGLTVTKALKQNSLTQNIPVVAFTAMVMKNDREKAFGAGCSGFIPKPIDISSFVADIEKYIENPDFNKISQEFKENNPKFSENITEKQNSSVIKWHKVLVVDDNPINTELLKEVLDQMGQSSVIAGNAKKALDVIESEKFDLILLDVMMPEISGFELIGHLKSHPKSAKIPVIFISALSETSDIIRGLDLGSYGYITKPYNIGELKARIKSALNVKDLQDELETKKNKLDLIFKFSADGIILLNSRSEIISCNNKFLKWIGKEKTEITGKKFESFFSDENKIEIPAHCNLIKEIILENKGKKIFLQANCSKINQDGYEAEGYVLVLRDVTGHKEIEAQKETFVATLTHDLKTPIRAEIRALELLLKGTFGQISLEQKNIIQDMLYSNKYMFNMVDTLLSTYKYDDGNIILKKEEFDINKLIESCCNNLKYIVEDRQQKLILDFEQEKLIIFADRLEIKRVIYNLLSNGINYTPKNGKIIIKSEIEDKEAKISFIDNGKGISQQEMGMLFSKYTSYAKKFRHVGTGLGLYLSKQILEHHNGKIQVESLEGKGSVFSFSLPISLNC